MSIAPVPALDHDFSLDRLHRLLRTRDTEIEWRHDVDFDPDCALKMAQTEHRLGVHSTYYVMARGDYYNPFGPKTLQLFREIIGYGHTLGLHVDLQVGRSARVATKTMRVACENDFTLFLAGGLAVSRKVTFHAPPRDVYWREVPGFEHMLGPDWKNRYVGDSRGVWRESPEDRIAAGGPVQINLHPEWHFWPAGIAANARKVEAAKP